MRVFFYFATFIIALIFFLFFYKFVKRICNVVLNKQTAKVRTIVSIVTAIVLVIPVITMQGIWILSVIYLFFISLICNLIVWIINKYKTIDSLNKLIHLGIIPIALTAVIICWGYFNIRNVHVTEYTVSTQKNMSQSYKVAMISDIHYPLAMEKEDIEKYCREISDMHPDIVVLDGDIVDENTEKSEMEDVFEALGSIENQYGIYYVYGNHDKNRYTSDPNYTMDELSQVIEANHIHILLDTSVEINDDFVIVGRDDYSTYENNGRKSDEEILQGVDKNRFILMLDHQPRAVEKNAESGVDLQLSGHTHGGQFFPVAQISRLTGVEPWTYGKKEIGDFKLIVSSGMPGWGIPVRTQAVSEIVMIDIISD